MTNTAKADATKTSTLTIKFGTFADMVRDQLEEQNIAIPDESIDEAEHCVAAINTLAVHGILAPSAVSSARRRVLSRIIKAVENTQISVTL